MSRAVEVTVTDFAQASPRGLFGVQITNLTFFDNLKFCYFFYFYYFITFFYLLLTQFLWKQHGMEM